jgi:hypothetical protein
VAGNELVEGGQVAAARSLDQRRVGFTIVLVIATPTIEPQAKAEQEQHYPYPLSLGAINRPSQEIAITSL